MNVNEIVGLVSKEFNIPRNEIIGRRRTKDIVMARQSVMFVARQKTDLTLEQIGRQLGNRTPATVSYGYQKIARFLEK